MTATPNGQGAPQQFEKVLSESDTRVASFDEKSHNGLERFQHFLHSSPAAMPLIVLLFSVVLFGLVVGSKFFSAFTLTLILQQVAVTGIIGIAQTLVILTAGIDLSVGGIMVLSSVVMGQCAMHYGIPDYLAVVCGLLVGVACGVLNGVFVAYVKLPPFIVTLGFWLIFQTSNYIYTANETIRNQDLTDRAPFLLFLGGQVSIGNAVFTYGVILMVLMVAYFWYLLNYTALGRHVYAIGDDPDAASLSGIRVDRLLLAIYMIGGLICAVAGWALIGRVGAVSPQSGQLSNIDSITAVVIGGSSLFGGRGSIIGTMFGALIVGVFALGLRQWGTDPQWTDWAKGALIIGAVAVDQWIRKVSA